MKNIITKLSLLGASVQLAVCHLITSPASLSTVSPTAYPGIGIHYDGLFGRLPGVQLARRSLDCDTQNVMFCPTGTCFTNTDGLIGCCSVASCAPRTICIPYTPGITSKCNVNTGGCTYCSDPASPSCMTVTNPGMTQWIHYCDAVGYMETITYSNPITTGSEVGVGDSISTSSSIDFDGAPAMGRPPTSQLTSTTSPSTLTSLEIATISPTSTSAVSAKSSPANTNVAKYDPEPDKDDQHQHTSSSRGVVAGIILGAAAVGACIGAAIWVTRRRWQSWLKPKREAAQGSLASEKSPAQGRSPSSPGKGLIVETSGSSPHSSSSPSPPSIFRNPVYGYHKDSVSAPFAIDQVSIRGLGIAGNNPRHFAPTNPDPLSATDEDASPTDIRAPDVDAMAAAPSSLAPSGTAIVSASGDQPNHTVAEAPGAPMTPIHDQDAFTPYTPSLYAYEPPSSIPRAEATAPPSLPQDYSMASLGSTTDI